MPRCRTRSMIAGLLACGALTAGTAHADELRVVASIKPVHSLVAGVMQGAGEPALLIEGAASPHTYSLRPSAARALADADVVLWIGEDLETFLIKPLEALAPRARTLELAASEGLTLLPTREGGTWPGRAHGPHADDEHAGDEHAGDEHAAEAVHHEETAHHDAHAGHATDQHDGHAHGAFDMHLWLDPRNASVMVGRMAAVLGEADPPNAELFAANAAALRERLAGLDDALDDRLAPVRERPFVVFHDAYHYFEHRYRLNAAGAITISPERRPGAERLGEIRARLAELGAACVFAEPQFEPALVRTVVEGTGARTGTLDPLGAGLEPGPKLYFELMHGLAAAMVDCLAPTRAE